MGVWRKREVEIESEDGEREWERETETEERRVVAAAVAIEPVVVLAVVWLTLGSQPEAAAWNTHTHTLPEAFTAPKPDTAIYEETKHTSRRRVAEMNYCCSKVK